MSNPKIKALEEKLATFDFNTTKVTEIGPMPQWWRMRKFWETDGLFSEVLNSNPTVKTASEASSTGRGDYSVVEFHVDSYGKPGVLCASSSNPTIWVKPKNSDYFSGECYIEEPQQKRLLKLKQRRLKKMTLYWLPPMTPHRQPVPVNKRRHFLRYWVKPE